MAVSIHSERAAAARAAAAPAAPRVIRGDGEVSRERILRAALRLFAEQGYPKTPIRQIAQLAQVNLAAVNYYFGDKAGLYRAVYGGLPKRPGAADAAVRQAPGSAVASLPSLFEQFLEPLKRGHEVRLWMKLHRREMLEPTGLWKEKLENGIRPMHASIVAILCERLGLARADDDVHRLAIAVAGLAVHLYIGHDAVVSLAPQLFRRAQDIDLWRERLLAYADAMIASERRRRRRFAVAGAPKMLKPRPRRTTL
ncbi:MAG TPA: CerR family C-terminal domain-containing protein [Burkholderiaceae bacterium]|nr:CerR family C-terminal domain-containing protein [Burkholderiaceae bacterium]